VRGVPFRVAACDVRAVRAGSAAVSLGTRRCAHGIAAWSCLPDLLPLVAEAVDFQVYDVAWGKVGVAAPKRHALRGAGVDDVARIEDGDLAEPVDQFGDREDHVLGAGILARLAVHPGAKAQRLRVVQFVGGDKPGSERVERLAAFALGPLPAACFELERSFGDVVGDRVAGDVIKGLIRRVEVAGPPELIR
jgi:hypothetical protein